MANFLDFLFGNEEERKKKQLASAPPAVPYGPAERTDMDFQPMAPSFGSTSRAQPKPISQIFKNAPTGPIVTPTALQEEALRLQPNGASSQGSSLQVKTAVPKPVKMSTTTDNMGEIQGLIDEKILATGSIARISEAVIAKQREIAEQQYNPIDEKSSWFQRFWEPSKQALKTPGDTLITQAQNIANYGLEPLGYVSRPVTSKGQLEALDRFLEKHAPERLIESKIQRSIAGEQSMPQGAAEFTTNIATTAVAAVGAISAFRSLPIAARLKSMGESGIYATHFMENLIASAVASVPGSVGKKKAGDFHKLMITNGGFLFPTATYSGLAIATTASFLGNVAMGQNPWEAAANSALGLTGAASQRKGLLDDLYTYRKGAFTDALRGLIRSQWDDSVPKVIQDAAIDEGAQLRAYYEQNPQDLDGLYKMTMDSQKKMIKLYAEYKAPSPAGERRMIGFSGPMQNGPDGGFPVPAGDPDMPPGMDPARWKTLKAQYGDVDSIPINEIDRVEFDRVQALPDPKAKITVGGKQVPTKDGYVYRYESNSRVPEIQKTGMIQPNAEGEVFGAVHPEIARGLAYGQGKELLHGGQGTLFRTRADAITGPLFADPNTPVGKDGFSFISRQPMPVQEMSVDNGATWLPVTPPAAVAPTPQGAFPSVFNRPVAPPGIPMSPRLPTTPTQPSAPAAFSPSAPAAPQPIPGVAPRASTAAQEPAGQSSVIPQGVKPVPLPEARRMAVDVYRELDSEYNPGFRSLAENGPQYADAEQNAALAQELVTNPQIRGDLQQVTGKQGYNAIEQIELDDMGPFVQKLRAATENGSRADEAIANIQRRIKDDVDGEYGRAVLNNLIAKSRGEVKAPRARPNEEEILGVLDRALQDGRLQLDDDLGGRTVEEVYGALYNEQARKSDAELVKSGSPPSVQNNTKAGLENYVRQKLAKNAARRELLGDVLKRDSVKQVKKQTLSKQGIAQLQDEANLSNKELAAIHQYDDKFESDLEQSRKLTQIEYNKTVAAAKELPPEVAKKIIADLERMKATGKIATPLEARLQKNKFLTKLLTQQKGLTRAAQRNEVRAKKDANHERMKTFYKTLPKMPKPIQKMMKFLHDGYRKSMPLTQQEQIVAQMKDLNEIGAQQNRLFKEKRDAADASLAKEVLKTAVRKVKNRQGRVRDRVGPLLMNETPPNLVIADMGEGAFKVFKDSMDAGMKDARTLQRDLDRQVLEKAKELGIKNADMQKIVDYSLWNRGGKAGELAQARLMNMGVVDPRDPPTLDAKQKAFYDWQQDFIKKNLSEPTKAVFEKENPLRELDISDPNYFSMKVVGNDFTVSKGPNTMSIDQVPDGFTKSIKGNEEVDLYREPDALFRHINDVAHYVTLTEKMQQMRRLLERPEIISALGNENVDYLQNRWLDLVARHGTYAEKVNEAMAMINSMGQRAYGGILAGKMMVGLRQFGSILDAIGPMVKQFGIGKTAVYLAKVVKNTPAIINEHWTNLGAYIETNPDLQASVGLTDLVMEQVKGGEFSSRHLFLERHPKLNKFIFAVIRQPDLLGRATLAMHVEGLYRAQDVPQPEAQRLAMQLVNNVFGSMRVHNRPTASGHANTRPLYLFGQTQRARQGMFRHAMRDFKEDPVGNGAVMGSYLLSSMIMMYLSTLVIADDNSREKAQKQSIAWGWFLAGIENTIPILGPIISRTLQTGDASNAIPYVGMLMNALSNYRQVFTGKKPETKVKGFLRGTEQTLGAAGIPAPAIRSNLTLLQNIYHSLAGGESPASIMPPETVKEIEQLKKDLKKELGDSGLEDMKKQLRKELQNVR